MKQGTARIVCTCEHEFQDKMYGNKTRVANTTAKANEKTIEVRCTVCKRIHHVPESRVK